MALQGIQAAELYFKFNIYSRDFWRHSISKTFSTWDNSGIEQDKGTGN